MGAVYCMGECYNCRRVFSFNMNYVPSLRVDGVRVPFCRACIEQANPVRVKNGLAAIVPHPQAYEPEEEA